MKGGETAVERFDSISLDGARAFERMDGAWPGSIDIALHKAKTSRNFDMPTGSERSHLCSGEGRGGSLTLRMAGRAA